MSVPSYKAFLGQQSSDEVHPSQGTSQFKAPMKVQSGILRAQSQHFSIQGSIPSQGISQFKAPLKVQSGTLRAQSQPFAALGTPPFNHAFLSHVTNPSQPLVQQPATWNEHSGYSSHFGLPRSNDAWQDTVSTMPLPRVQAFPSTDAHTVYSAGNPIAPKSHISTMHPTMSSTDSSIALPVPHSSLGTPRQFSQLLRATNQSWQSARPQTEPAVRLEVLRKTKAHVTIKVILLGGTGLFAGGMASFWLLRFPTYLVVTWAILIIVLSNLISRELRSYYRLQATTQSVNVGQASPLLPDHDEDMGRHPELKDITDTTGYLKALSLVARPGHPAQNFAEKEYRV